MLLKSYKVFVRKPGTIVWNYADTYEGAKLAWTAQTLARLQGCEVRTKEVTIAHKGVVEYAHDMASEKVLL